MRPVISFVSTLLIGTILATSGWSQTARDYCPEGITTTCIGVIADQVIKNSAEDKDQQASLAMDYASQIVSTQPDKALELFRSYGSRGDKYSLLSMAERLVELGQNDAAREVFRVIAQNRIDDPNPSTKMLDIVVIAGDMAEAGYLDLTKETHIKAVEFLPGTVDGYVPFSEELRLARLMGLYGWPEESEPWFTAAYDRIIEIPEGTHTRGFTLTNFMTVAWIIGNTSLAERAAKDLLTFYETATPEVQQQVMRSEISALAESGRTEDAKSEAQSYGMTLANILSGTPSLFLDQETDYVPGIFPDTRERYEKMIAALETEEAKGQFIDTLASKLIYMEIFDEVEDLLPRVTTPEERSDMVLTLMMYYAREKNDSSRAADLYFAEFVRLTPKFPQLGTLIKRYPLSLTAEGLWLAGDHDRALILSDKVFELWIADQSDEPTDERQLIAALARAGQDEIIADWLVASPSTDDSLKMLEWAARGKAVVGEFDRSEDYLSEARSLLPKLSDEAVEPPDWWPEGEPMPTERANASERLADTKFEIIREMAKQDQLELARTALAEAGDGKAGQWRVKLEIARAEERAGNADKAEVMRWSMLEEALSTEARPTDVIYMVTSLSPEEETAP